MVAGAGTILYLAAGGSRSVGSPARWRKNATARLIEEAGLPVVRLLAFLPVRETA